MPHEFAFADAVRPTPIRVLRLPLRDYSLGHELLLIRARNAIRCLAPPDFDILPLPAQIFAAKQAAWICANTWSANHREPFAGLKLRLWGWLTRRADYPLAIADLRNHLTAGSEGPHFAAPDPNSGARELGTPELLQLYHHIAQHPFLRSFIRDLWDFPLSLAKFHYYGSLEMDGKVRLQNSTDIEAGEFDRWCAEMDAAETAATALSTAPTAPTPEASHA